MEEAKVKAIKQHVHRKRDPLDAVLTNSHSHVILVPNYLRLPHPHVPQATGSTGSGGHAAADIRVMAAGSRSASASDGDGTGTGSTASLADTFRVLRDVTPPPNTVVFCGTFDTFGEQHVALAAAARRRVQALLQEHEVSTDAASMRVPILFDIFCPTTTFAGEEEAVTLGDAVEDRGEDGDEDRSVCPAHPGREALMRTLAQFGEPASLVSFNSFVLGYALRGSLPPPLSLSLSLSRALFLSLSLLLFL